MRNTESVTNAALAGKTFKASALSTNGSGEIYSYRMLIAKKTGFDSWEVMAAGGVSVTTSKHCNGVARELHLRGQKVTRI